MKQNFKLKFLLSTLLVFIFSGVYAQWGQGTYWSADGNKIMRVEDGNIVQVDAMDASKTSVLISKEMLTPKGEKPLNVVRFAFADGNQKVLINTNTKKVWRYDTRGDSWVYDLQAKTLKQVGKDKPESSLMFAKFSPDAKKVAYVSEHNLYVEDLASGETKALTTDGTLRLINGTFDWVYEEELDCRDGFRWSPDSKSIAYWQIDARKIKNYLMLNTTDSLYPFTVPVEYPVVGQDPSSCKVGIVDISTAKTKWMNVPGDAVQHYIPRMEWANNSTQLIIQQLNRRQNESKIMLLNAADGSAKTIYSETDKAWVDAKAEATGWTWIDGGKKFIWLSEKDGWRHIYAIGLDGKETLLTKDAFDAIELNLVDEKGGNLYFMASPDNATQKYLYRVSIKGGNAVKVTPTDEAGTHSYDISPNGKLAFHVYSSSIIAPLSDVVSLPNHKRLSGGEVDKRYDSLVIPKVEFFKVKTEDGIEMDGWMIKPKDFDPKKKYPVVFYVYGEPASQTVVDRFGTGFNRLYTGDMANDGYIYMSVDGRGSPAPKGREWRKSIYHKIGDINIRDQAMAAKEILKWDYVDKDRVAVWGWSGGGSSTLNLLMQYPEIYKTGISIAAVDNQLNYDNIYQERYMGLLPEDKHYFVDNSPLAHAKNLQGNLLLIHGTGDDNVHYNNAEQMINQLIKYGKTFQMMSYPNRTHGIYEGEGTSKHLALTYTKFLKENCPPGGK
ncbi:MAG: S9 family peptidase [Bacteroidetes bacterium]|nr:S9 family peptidase [Bacteroidota bacterium]MBU1373453.1 S9 family peptidase [Bacteroidota bacterium]MBU1485211.1 S9 family peptidase [Bacteroidota bacterium]MBU1761440.1 S9 family peptidase [Bacteroidota bacterium]MBU2046505.1 S9 family peptidase [Bacteroidota bacterium]